MISSKRFKRLTERYYFDILPEWAKLAIIEHCGNGLLYILTINPNRENNAK